MEISVYTDGGSRGNPGPAGYGLVIYDQHQQIIHQNQQYLGIKTNNEAEYSGLLAALTWVVANQDKLNIQKVIFHSDSELLVRQLTGQYKVKSVNIKPLFAQAQVLLSQLQVPVSFHHLYRESNTLADSLANAAMDQHD